MSKNWVTDVGRIHEKYGAHEWVKNNPTLLEKFLEFRLKFLQEELEETIKAAHDYNPEEIVDGLIDLCVVAIGTLDLFGIDSHKAWNEVLRANMEKRLGVKESRPNPLGFPDLIKPENWEPPSHEENHGLFTALIHEEANEV